MISILPEDSIEQLRLRFGTSISMLRPEEVQILIMTLDEGAITNFRLQEVLTIHRTDLTRILQQLVRKGFLGRLGFGRGTRYELSPNSAAVKGDLGLQPNTETSTETSPGTSKPAAFGEDTRLIKDRNRQLWAALLSDTEVVRQRARMTKRELQNTIIHIMARTGWRTRTEMALFLGRNAENIRGGVIRPLLSSRSLTARYSSRNHPDQAYALGEKTDQMAD